jgi:hypothetical protein
MFPNDTFIGNIALRSTVIQIMIFRPKCLIIVWVAFFLRDSSHKLHTSIEYDIAD